MNTIKKYTKTEQLHNKNQFVIEFTGGYIFQSYNSICAIWKDGKLTLGRDWDYSTTTSEHLYIFINKYVNDAKINQVNNKNNKRNYINKLIAEGYIAYDEWLE